MRSSPTKNQMKAREMYLDCHRSKIVRDYQLQYADLHFDEDVVEVMLGDVYIGAVLFDWLHTKEGVERILKIQKEHRIALINVLEHPSFDYRVDWNVELDYESIILDKVLDLERTPAELLVVPSGRAFFLQQRMFKLMHQGFQLAKKDIYDERSAWFSQFDDFWYFKHASTKYRMIDILQQYRPQLEHEFAAENVVEHSSLDEIFEEMRELHSQIRIAGAVAQKNITEFIARHPAERHYVTFVVAAMEYNEELRLFRSLAIFNFLKGCQQHSLNPYSEFLSVLEERKQVLEDKYKNQPHIRATRESFTLENRVCVVS